MLGVNDHTCGSGLQCMHTLKGKLARSTGICKPFLGALDECVVRGEDGQRREYRCEPGYKCTKRYFGADEAKRCHKRYDVAEGEASIDPELCQGGHADNG